MVCTLLAVQVHVHNPLEGTVGTVKANVVMAGA